MWVRGGLMMLLFGMLLTLAGCGGGDDEQMSLPMAGEAMDYVEYDAEFDAADEPASYMDAEIERSSAIGADIYDRRVIRNGEMELAVSDVNAAVRYARDIAPDVGGYVEASATRTLSNGDEIADLTLEVPSGSFDEAIDRLRNGPHVERVEWESTSSRDVTEEYVDLRAQLTNLESTERRFAELLDAATTIDEILRVEGELSRIRGDIDRIQGRLNYLEQRTDYSRIYVSFFLEEDGGVTVAGQHFTPGQAATDAWNSSMRFIGTVGNALVTVVVFFWWAWPILALLIGLGVIYSRRRRRGTPPDTEISPA